MNATIHNPHNINLKGVTIYGDGAIYLGQGCEIRDGTIIELGSGILRLGKRSVIGFHSFLQVTGEINIGAGSLLGSHCCYIASRHRVIPGKNLIDIPLIRGKITICDNVWIGAHATINDGVYIGDSAIIGANSFVNKSVPAGQVFGGVPAKFIKNIGDMK